MVQAISKHVNTNSNTNIKALSLSTKFSTYQNYFRTTI